MRVSVIGGGSWGTSFANYLAGIKKINTKIWTLEKEVAEAINNSHENPIYLPDIKLSENLKATTNLEEAIKNSEILVLAIPSKFCPDMYKKISPFLKSQYIVSLTKGLDEVNIAFLSDRMKEVFPKEVKDKISIISGPSFAKELAQKFPTAVVVASENEETARLIQKEFSSEILRLYVTEDIHGVELGGALKNVIAIAAGIAAGMGFGYNSIASLITRGNIEIIRLGLKLGAKEQTFLGLSGIGDLMLTCFGPLSRNRTFGFRVGRGERIEEILKDSKFVVEGLTTVKTALKLARSVNIEMPITEHVYKIIYKDLPVKEALKSLMGRSLKKEWNIR